MKKIIAFALAVLLVVTGTVGAFALIQFPVDIKGEISDYPVVFVPGYGGGWLMLGDDPETASPAWHGVEFDALLQNVLNRIAEVALAIGTLSGWVYYEMIFGPALYIPIKNGIYIGGWKAFAVYIAISANEITRSVPNAGIRFFALSSVSMMRLRLPRLTSL